MMFDIVKRIFGILISFSFVEYISIIEVIILFGIVARHQLKRLLPRRLRKAYFRWRLKRSTILIRSISGWMISAGFTRPEKHRFWRGFSREGFRNDILDAFQKEKK